TCELVSLVLGQAGYEIVSGRSVSEGLQLIRNNSYDFILTDWYFADGTGIDFCQAIREFDTRTPIFFYTGMVHEPNLRRIMEAGAQGFFIKPVEMETLLQTISSEVGSRKPMNPH